MDNDDIMETIKDDAVELSDGSSSDAVSSDGGDVAFEGGADDGVGDGGKEVIVDDVSSEADTPSDSDMDNSQGQQEDEESTGGFTEEQLTDALRSLLSSAVKENTEDKEDVQETTDFDDGSDVDISGDGDYSETLDAILLNIEALRDSDMPMNVENIYSEIGALSVGDSVDSSLDDLSASNVLLCFVVLLLLVDIAFRVGKGVLT